MMQLHFNFFVNFNSLIAVVRHFQIRELKFSTYSCTMEFYTESPLTSKVVCEFWEHFSSFSPGWFCKSFQDVVLRKGHNRVSCLLDQKRNLPLQETNEKSSWCKFSYKFNFFFNQSCIVSLNYFLLTNHGDQGSMFFSVAPWRWIILDYSHPR